MTSRLDTSFVPCYTGIKEVRKMAQSRAKIEANARYDKKAYDNVLVKFSKDAQLTLPMVKEFAAAHGESTNGFIVRVITEAIEREQVEH